MYGRERCGRLGWWGGASGGWDGSQRQRRHQWLGGRYGHVFIHGTITGFGQSGTGGVRDAKHPSRGTLGYHHSFRCIARCFVWFAVQPDVDLDRRQCPDYLDSDRWASAPRDGPEPRRCPQRSANLYRINRTVFLYREGGGLEFASAIDDRILHDQRRLQSGG